MKNISVLLTIGLILMAGLLIVSCSEEDTVEVDTVAPSVRITSPQDSIRIAAAVLVRASASDNTRVEVVEFFANGLSLGRDTESPFQVEWDPRTDRSDRVGEEFEIKARAWDVAGNTALSNSHFVTFFIDSLPPSITILEPADQDEITGPITIRTAPTDNDQIFRVDFVVDNVIVGSAHEEPWEWNWNVGPFADGLSHTITVKAVDLAQQFGVSTPVSVTVSILAAPPVVRIIEPGSNALLIGDQTTILATAVDQDEVVHVDFFLDGVMLASLTEPPYSIPLDLVYYANDAERLIEVEATDARGNVGAADPITPTVAASANLQVVTPADEQQLSQLVAAQIDWERIESAVEYTYEIARDPEFQDIAFTGATADTLFNLGIVEDGWYYWRVNVSNEVATSEWSEMRSFHVGIIFSRVIGSTANGDELRFVEVLDDGGFVAVGYRGASASGDTTTRQGYIFKMDEAGTLLWAEPIGDLGLKSELAHVMVMPNGNFIATGYREIDTGPEETHRDLWLLCADDNGNTLWETFHGGEGDEEGFSVTETASGGYMAVGYTTSSGAGGYDLWMLEADALGNEIASWSFGGAGYDVGNSIRATADGGYVMAGNTTSIGNGGKDVWLLKVDGSSVMEWQRTKGLVLDDWGRSVHITADGGYLVAGTTQSFGAGVSDGMVWKTDAAGNEMWGRTYGTGGADGLSYLAETRTGDGYILTGVSKEVWAGQNDLWLLRLDLAGNEIWSKTYPPGGTEDMGYCVQPALDGGFVAVGASGSFSGGTLDGWLLKTSSTGQTVALQ